MEIAIRGMMSIFLPSGLSNVPKFASSSKRSACKVESEFVNYKWFSNARKIIKKVITNPIMKKNQKNHWA